MNRPNLEAGFSLIELLIVIIIGTVILLGVFQFFDTGLQVWNRIQDVEEPKYHLIHNLDLIADELENAYSGGSLTDFIGTDQQNPDTGVDNDTLQFIETDGRLPSQPGYDLKRVGYYIGSDNSGLTKQSDAFPFQEPVTDNTLPDPDQPLLMHGIVEFTDSIIHSLNFRYFDGTGWVDAWDSREMGGLPQAVEVTLGITDTQSPDKQITVTRVIRLNRSSDLTPNETRDGNQ